MPLFDRIVTPTDIPGVVHVSYTADPIALDWRVIVLFYLACLFTSYAFLVFWPSKNSEEED